MHQAQGNEKSLKRGGGEEQALGEFNRLSSSTFIRLMTAYRQRIRMNLCELVRDDMVCLVTDLIVADAAVPCRCSVAASGHPLPRWNGRNF